MGTQKEINLENNLINQIISQGYERVNIKNEKDLLSNLRIELFNLNRKNLNNTPLTNKEFERLLSYLDGNSIFKNSEILRDKVLLERDDNTKVYIKLLDKDVSKNSYKITNQITVKGKYTNRYDVTLLINGFPLVQIELKSRGNDLKEAFEQIKRYKKHSYTGLFRYTQLFVISNGVNTKYFANGDQNLKFDHTFYFSDMLNKRISDLKSFSEVFFEKDFLTNVISNYIIINQSDKMLMVMRPYQIYAVKNIIDRAKNSNENGYIWHTTGSGKTLTSFKASQILSNDKDIKKVFFLVDRKDLDAQTISEFNKFEKDSVDITDSTSNLVEQINDTSKKLIVTTIQKMANSIKNEKYSDILNDFKDKKVVFIIDECHRSQFGDMHKSINKHFKNAQYFGFTGTPRFVENKSNTNQITTDLFEKCLHTYLTKDAINDKNVLGFNVEYVKTFEGAFDESDDEICENIDKNEVFTSDIRVSNVARNIIDIHDLKTNNKKYNAIFAVSSIEMLIKYYNEFKKIDHNLKIASIFSVNDNQSTEDNKKHTKDSLNLMIDDYNKMFGSTIDNFSSYFSNISKKVKNCEIDILIVVNMFLTGFDSKTLNTLYVDKNLKYHDLVQAFSRTNRIESANKPHGNVVCYRNLKKNTDDAIRLFSESDNTDTVLMKSFEEYLSDFKEKLFDLKNICETPKNVDDLVGESEKKDFIVTFRDLTKILTRLNTFTEFEFEEKTLGISKQTYMDYKSKYLDIYEETKKPKGDTISILDDIDFLIEIMHTDKINVDYILNLIREIDLTNKDNIQNEVEKIIKTLTESDNEKVRLKVDLIKEFLEKVVPTLGENSQIDDNYSKFEERKKDEEIEIFSTEIGLNKSKIKNYISEFEYSNIIDTKLIDENLKDDLKATYIQRRKLKDSITNFIKSHISKFI
ncbi:MAG: type I restriction endonuclease subunit R [Peptostreptococcaceae bacterium]